MRVFVGVGDDTYADSHHSSDIVVVGEGGGDGDNMCEGSLQRSICVVVVVVEEEVFITMVKKQYTDVRKSVYCFWGYYIRTCTIYYILTNRDFFNIRTFTIYGLAFRT